MDILIGRVLTADDHPGSRAPSYRLRVDLGPRGEREASMEPGGYRKDELVGTQIAVSLVDDEAIVVAARSHGAGPVLLRPDREVEDGTVVA